MSDLIELIATRAADPAREAELLEEIAAHAESVRDSAGGGDGSLVEAAEEVVRHDPASAFAFDAAGSATLNAAGRRWAAGRFETPSIGELRSRVGRESAAAPAGGAKLRLWVLDGASPATDIGGLQATSQITGGDTLFQVASQFNCLESPGPYVTDVAHYFSDPTQGPRAAVSAFPATLLRHYAAPGPDGRRFVQETDGPQIDLLADACGPGVVRNGYFTGRDLADPRAVVAALEERFDAIRVGVHDDAQVVLGYRWEGGVEDSDRRRIAQVLTSTVSGGMYGAKCALGDELFEIACRQLLRAAYLGTLLAAASLGRRRVVLTLIGGSVFGNPVRLIWESILWAADEVGPLLAQDLDVFVNGYNLGGVIDLEAEVLPEVRARGGVICEFDAAGAARIRR